MNLNEAKQILRNAGYIVEDKYMDDMDDELEEILRKNKNSKDLDELKSEFKRQVRMLPKLERNKFYFEYNNRYSIEGENWYNNEDDHGFKFIIYDNKIENPIEIDGINGGLLPEEFTFFIDKQLSNKVNTGDVKKFIDTFIPFLIKLWEKQTGGFFRRLFKRG